MVVSLSHTGFVADEGPVARPDLAGAGQRSAAHDVPTGANVGHQLRDIGLTSADVNDATALPLDADPSSLLVRRRAWRERTRSAEKPISRPDPA